MSRRKYQEEPEGDESGWTRRVQPRRRGYGFACCDCSLVHVMDFRVYRGRAQFRAKRDKRKTAALRREAVRRGDRLWYVATKGDRTTVHVLH